MKKFMLGLSAGYLLTSIFSISAPPVWFWWILIFLGASAASAGACWYRFNDDLRDGEF